VGRRAPQHARARPGPSTGSDSPPVPRGRVRVSRTGVRAHTGPAPTARSVSWRFRRVEGDCGDPRPRPFRDRSARRLARRRRDRRRLLGRLKSGKEANISLGPGAADAVPGPPRSTRTSSTRSFKKQRRLQGRPARSANTRTQRAMDSGRTVSARDRVGGRPWKSAEADALYRPGPAPGGARPGAGVMFYEGVLPDGSWCATATAGRHRRMIGRGDSRPARAIGLYAGPGGADDRDAVLRT